MATYMLKKPLKNGSDEIKSLEIPDELMAGHLRGVSLEMNQFDDMLKILENSTKQPRSVIDRLSMNDLTEVTAMLGKLMGEGNFHQTGTI